MHTETASSGHLRLLEHHPLVQRSRSLRSDAVYSPASTPWKLHSHPHTTPCNPHGASSRAGPSGKVRLCLCPIPHIHESRSVGIVRLEEGTHSYGIWTNIFEPRQVLILSRKHATFVPVHRLRLETKLSALRALRHADLDPMLYGGQQVSLGISRILTDGKGRPCATSITQLAPANVQRPTTRREGTQARDQTRRARPLIVSCLAPELD